MQESSYLISSSKILKYPCVFALPGFHEVTVVDLWSHELVTEFTETEGRRKQRFIKMPLKGGWEWLVATQKRVAHKAGVQSYNSDLDTFDWLSPFLWTLLIGCFFLASRFEFQQAAISLQAWLLLLCSICTTSLPSPAGPIHPHIPSVSWYFFVHQVSLKMGPLPHRLPVNK
jgi:hypothetical protein